MPIVRLDLQIHPANPGVPSKADFEEAILYQSTPAGLSGLIPAGTANVYEPSPRNDHGFKYSWLNGGVAWTVWGHDPIKDAQPGSLSAKDWTFRVKCGGEFLSPVDYGKGQGGRGGPSRWWGGQHADKTHILLEHN